MLRAGVGRATITPPLEAGLAGYGIYLHRKARWVHDDLTARVLMLDDGLKRVALVACDLVGLDEWLAHAIRAEVRRVTKARDEEIVLACIHTHTGPTATFMRGWGEVDRGHLEVLPKLVGSAAWAALEGMVDVEVGAGSGEHSDLAWNRTRTEEGHIDPDVPVWAFRAKDDGRLVATVISYACHPVMLGPKPVISADYVWATRLQVEEEVGGTCLFFTGACGDIDPVSNSKAWGKADFDRVERDGRALGMKAAEVVRGMEFGDVGLKLWARRVELPLRVPGPGEEEAFFEEVKEFAAPQGVLEQENDMARRQWLARMAMFRGWESERWLELMEAWYPGEIVWTDEGWAPAWRKDGGHPGVLRVAFRAVALGDSALVAVPGEVFSRIGKAVKEVSPFRPTFFVGYADRYIGYIPTREDFQIKSYASSFVPFLSDLFPYREDVGEVMVREAAGLLEEMRR
ncbi:MAG TPA: hypothetical protein EYP17_05565 [Candidatus Latescibacteria bacterium]|nr:hypothetical protein [Candidatus Latescibacterota bacterium]